MLSTILSGAMLLQTPTKMTTPEVVSVSMFKNGFAFITRKIAVKDGEANIVEVPRASLGTLWFWTPEGEIQNISTSEEESKKKVELSLQNFDQLVSKNVGKAVVIESNTSAILEGKIKSSDGELVVIETSNGSVAIQKSAIKNLRTQDSTFIWKQTFETTTQEKYYRIKADRKTHEVMMMSLERGVTWAPGYAVDITNPDKLTLASKATVLNDLLDLKSVPARLITGFPNMQFKDILDPFTSNMTSDLWLASLSSGGGGGFGSNGRMAGQGGQMMSQNAYAPMMDKDVNWGGNSGGEVGGEQISDLFFYDLPKFDSKKNSRLYQNLFKFESEYKHIYTWDIDDQVDANGNYKPVPVTGESQDVWHPIKFKNGASKPLTTAPATIFNRGNSLARR